MNSFLKYNKVEDMPNKISIFPLNGALLLPRSQLPLNIFEPRYLEMIDNSISSDRVIGMIQTQESDDNRLYSIGCVGRITSFTELPDSRLIITLNGICRYKVIEELDALTPYRQVKVSYDDFENDLISGFNQANADRDKLLVVLKKYLEKNNLQMDWDAIKSSPTETLVNSLCTLSPYSSEEKQALLEAENIQKRNELLIAMTEMALSTNKGIESIQ
ncbi:MAG: LON peptidase substrate-binding domain-containing protein [Pseudomonadota bacterium]|nr:LON peptidase substrate-binding domain-containing protein [Pseudomonadota bacterium]